MKKHLSLVIALIAICVLFPGVLGCGGSSRRESSERGSDKTSSSASLETVTESAAANSGDSFSPDDAAETVIVDNEYCSFTIRGVKNDKLWGYSWNVLLENKSDINLMFSVDNVSVNGYMCDPFFAETVTPGMKSNASVSFSDSSLKQCGITTPTDFEFTLRVYDSDNWMGDDIVEEVFSYYPYGKENAAGGSSISKDAFTPLFENEMCSMYVIDYEEDNIWGYTMNVYLENNTDKTLMFAVNDASVNGFMCDPFWATDVAPGKKAVASISWSKSSFEDNGITKVESITLPVRVYDSEDWMADDIVNESITVTP